MFTLSGRTAVITGATGYQGLGMVRALLDGGMNVVMMTHMPDRIAGIIASLPEEQRARCVAMMDSGKGDAETFRQVKEKFGSVDVVIPNHGPGPRPEGIDAFDREEMEKRLGMNVCKTLEMIRDALPYLKESKAGRIILMSSAGARTGVLEEGLMDNIVKGAVVSMTYALARELANDGITVNCVAKSGMVDQHPVGRPERGKPPVMGEPEDDVLKDKLPVGFCGTPENLGAAVAWLASEEAGFVTGEVVNLNGGYYMG